MSRRQRSARERALRARVAREKALRRRGRTRRAATVAASAVMLVVGGTAVPASVSGADATLSASLRTGSLGCAGVSTWESKPADLTDVDGTLFFTAFDNFLNPSLWRSDGTRAGTIWLNDLSGEERRYESYSDLEAAGSTLFFTADGFTHDNILDGRELWRSDGTKAGTVRVQRFRGIGGMAGVGSTLFFAARDRTRGGELWRSDGTKAGTVLVEDIKPGEDASSDPSRLTAVGDTLYFAADDGVHGRELWRSDGTAAGTALVADIRPGGSSSPSSLTAVGDTVFFWADDGVHGRELWKSDGTEAGTVLVKDIGTGDFGSDPYAFSPVGDTLYFSAVADDGAVVDLWRSDGTTDGTVVVRQMDARPEYPGYYDWRFDLAAVGDRVFFVAADPTLGRELWSTDGTEAGTALVKDITPGHYGSGPLSLTAVGDDLFFTAWAEEGQLWRSDGTAAGTTAVASPDPTGHTRPGDLTASGDRVFFTADDDVHGDEVWVSDGTEAGTHLARDVNRRVSWDLAGQARANRRNSAARIGATFGSPGRIAVEPVREGGVRALRQRIGPDTSVTLVLELTRAAKRKLRRNGRVEIGARFTFSSCTGAVSDAILSSTVRKR